MIKFIIILLLCCISCSVSNQDIPGIYIFKNEYIIDSLILSSNHSYRRVILSAENDEKLFYSNNDKWSYSNDFLKLENFLHKPDEGMFIVNSKDPISSFSTIYTNFNPTKTLFGNITIEIDRYNHYYKID
jgi:hypothetical protein